MITQPSRAILAVEAHECFRAQTYPNLELVVVVDHPTYRPPFGDVVSNATPGEESSLGHLRNLSMSAARGQIFCQWDDDDLYHPDRVSSQVEALLSRPANVCFLARETLRCACGHIEISHLREGRKGQGGFWENSMVIAAETARGLSYHDVERGEDTSFVKKLLVAKVSVATIDRPELYTYRFHGGNTWSAEHFDFLLRMSKSEHQASSCQARPAALVSQ